MMLFGCLLLLLGAQIFGQSSSITLSSMPSSAIPTSRTQPDSARSTTATPFPLSSLKTASNASLPSSSTHASFILTDALTWAARTAYIGFSENSTSFFSVLPVSSYSFPALPTSQPAIPGFSSATDPSKPPPVGSHAVPDFADAWAVAHRKAKTMVLKLTLEQKVNLPTGAGWENGRCVGNILPLNGTEFKGLCLEDSPLGVRPADFSTVFPAGINAAATWNRALMRKRGLAIGKEHVGKGVNVALGPMMNMGRVAQGGRNWEGFGGDPYLTGEAAYETILGMQEAGVQACAKHYINNEQEHSRQAESSDVDDRTQHEIYAHPFLRSVAAGVASVMCSLNMINGTGACENDKMMNDVLKREFGFQGYVMSDWFATSSTLSVVAGLDMTLPGDIDPTEAGTSYFGGNLTAFVQNGTISEARDDDMATRILAGWYLLKQDSPLYPTVNFNAFLPDDEATNAHVDVQDDHDQLVRDVGAASTVLLKNTLGALPLKKPRSLVLVGSDAGPPLISNQFPLQGGAQGTLAVGWGSGAANFTYLISPLEAIQHRARKDRTTVAWSLDDFNLITAASLAYGKSAALVFIQADSGEELVDVDGNAGDRKNLTAWHGGDELVNSMAAVNNNTIVVVHSVGPLILEPWIEHPNVTAVLWAGLPGTETGNALTEVLYDDYNPSGRLPYTIAKRSQDYGAQLALETVTPPTIWHIPYTEGLLIDYRWFDAKNITPRFEFGFGLSYTSWTYSNLKMSHVPNSAISDSALERRWAARYATPIAEGSSAALWLHTPYLNVTFDVENTGEVDGGEISQLYLNHPSSSGEPPSILKGFTNIKAFPGEKKSVDITLSRYDLSIWDAELQGWRLSEGTIKVTIGASSRDARLSGTLPLP